MKEIKNGETFYINVKSLGGFGLGKFDSVYEGEINALALCVEDKTSEYLIDNIKEDDVLLKLKYIGNGIFEEETTNEKIILDDNKVSFNDGTKVILDKEIKDYILDDLIYLNYDEYSNENRRNKNKLSIKDYIKSLESDIEIIKKYPLGFSCFNYEIPLLMTKKNKKQYLKYNDEVRKKYIEEAKQLSLQDSNKVIPFIENSIKKLKEVIN